MENLNFKKSKEEVETWLVKQIAERMHLSTAQVNTREAFVNMGLDSNEAVMLSGELSEWLGCELPPTIFWDYPSIAELSQYLGGEEMESVGCSGKNEDLTQARKDDVAIIGIGVRFPGANGPEEFWNLLRDGVDAVTPLPEERKSLITAYRRGGENEYSLKDQHRGGYLREIEYFDYRFFGISRREAEAMDPQQRILLEVVFEALEDAGMAWENMFGTSTGVFIGSSANDYGMLRWSGFEKNNFDIYSITGNSSSIVSNRVSYHYNFKGPSLTVDTACSSSLVAVHYACRSLLAGESTLAVAGGVNLILLPAVTEEFARAGMLAADGKCKVFDSRADGYVRGEGVGVLILKPWSRALEDKDNIYAVIKGSAVNQDGQSNGLTAPSRRSQEEVINEACQDAGVSPGELQYVEAHGTGTELGDPIEVKALGKILQKDRPSGKKCAVGSVKTNIGHLEAAAGVASLAKVGLSLKKGIIPPTINYKEPNPYIPFRDLPIKVQEGPGEWEKENVSVLAGVSSFGFGGTNAHIVLEQNVMQENSMGNHSDGGNLESPETLDGRAFLLPLSAHDPETLKMLAEKYYHFLTAPPKGVTLNDICYTAGLRRSHREFRLAVAGETPSQIAERLAGYLSSARVVPGGLKKRIEDHPGKLAFVFSGQESTCRHLVGRQLYESEPVFRETVEECYRLAGSYSGWLLPEEMFRERNKEGNKKGNGEGNGVFSPGEGNNLLEVFALQAALVELWRSWGITPDAVVGCGVNEVGCAYAAGIVNLKDAVRIVYYFYRFMQDEGKEEAETADPLIEELIGDLKPRLSRISIYSTVTGEAAPFKDFTKYYWGKNARETPLFSRAVRNAGADGYNLFVEIGPGSEFSERIRQEFNKLEREVKIYPSLGGGDKERVTMLDSLGGLYEHGHKVQWEKLYFTKGNLIKLPAYPWKKERCWFEVKQESAPGTKETTNTPDTKGTEGSTGKAAGVYYNHTDTHENGKKLSQACSYQKDTNFGGGENIEMENVSKVEVMELLREQTNLIKRQTELVTALLQDGSNKGNGNGNVGVSGRGQELQEVKPAKEVGNESSPYETSQGLKEQVLKIISAVTAFPLEQIKEEHHIFDDLGFDSIMVRDMAAQLMESFPGLEKDDEEYFTYFNNQEITVGNIISFLERELQEGDGGASNINDTRVLGSEKKAGNSLGEAGSDEIKPRLDNHGSHEMENTGGSSQVMVDNGVSEMECSFGLFPEYVELKDRLEAAGELNPYFRVNEGKACDIIQIEGTEKINFATYNYLGLNGEPEIIEDTVRAINRYGTSVSGSRLLSGEIPLHRELEKEVAGFLGTEDCIVYIGGFTTNVTTIGHLVGEKDIILHDSLIHNSVIQGSLLSGAARRPFPHNDWKALDGMLEMLRPSYRRALIVVEGVYSMDGDMVNLPEFIKVKKKHQALLMVDEAHSVGVVGEHGRGVGEFFEVNREDVDLWMGTFSKALSSCGGYIAGSKEAIDYLKYTAPGFIFSCGMSPANAAAALSALKMLQENPQKVERLRQNSEYFLQLAKESGLDTGYSENTPIIPVIIGDSLKCALLAHSLWESNINVLPIIYPAVEENAARLRFFVSALHNKEQIDHTINILSEEIKKLG